MLRQEVNPSCHGDTGLLEQMSIRVKVGTGYGGTLVAGEGPITSECNCVHQCMPDGHESVGHCFIHLLGSFKINDRAHPIWEKGNGATSELAYNCGSH